MNSIQKPSESPSAGVAGKIARLFIHSKLTPLIMVASILLGIAAVILLPREEEPQIKVPMIDVMVSMPGFSAQEVEERATRPMEELLWEIPGVEYIYSISRPEESLVIVRFKVGEDPDKSLVKLTQKLQANFDRIPPGVSFPLIKAKSIDDVPILALTLHSEEYDHLMLRRVAAELEARIKRINLVSETTLIGGARRQARVLVDPVRLAAKNISLLELSGILQQANRQFSSGSVTSQNQEILVETGGFFTSSADLRNLVIGARENRPVYLREVAEVLDEAEELSQYVFFGHGGAVSPDAGERAAVTISIAKRPGANAIGVARQVLRNVDALKESWIPPGIQVEVTRHYGETAAEKSNELLFHMSIAIVSVSLLILLTLGWRESGIVLLAIPSTLALTLLVFYLYGYTLNRITLFALIFSIGILVDDAIVVVENVVRHFRLPQNRGRSRTVVAVEAVNEVGNPTILATFAVIAAVLPMAFVGGLMGPYMRPIPVGASAAMIFSLAIAFIITPWAALRLLKKESSGPDQPGASLPAQKGTSPPVSAGEHPEDFFTRIYRRMMGPLINRAVYSWFFLGGILLLLLGSMALVGIGWVKVKMLPFDNKSEFQIILNMPEGSSLERTTAAAREIAAAIRVEPEVTDYQVYAGTAAPFNFNGLVRHYFLRSGPHVADIQVNLLPKHHRKAQSHDIAKRVRPQVAQIAEKYHARVAVAEVPPGPPVLQTLVAEIYGPDDSSRRALAREVREIFSRATGVVDVDWYYEEDQPKARFVIDREKAALHGIDTRQISETLRMATAGQTLGLLHQPGEREDLNIHLRFPRGSRGSPEDLLAIRMRSSSFSPHEPGSLVPLRELGSFEYSVADKSIHRKNLRPVIYVLGDVAGEVESPVYAIFEMNRALKKLDGREFGGSTEQVKIYNASLPFSEAEPSIKWDGEWHITLEVFRDLGLAFAAVLILIYVLMVGWFGSFLTPLIVMAAIPFSLVGILPAHGLMGAFFTATSMIGFMAGAGIVVRNSIILVDFIQLRLAEGMPLDEAVVDAGAVRFRPMMLTTMAVVVAAAVILFDPIFQGLAISLMAGEVASLFISRMAVPVLFFMAYKGRDGNGTEPPPAELSRENSSRLAGESQFA
jgi:multidrug efflux pump subunit AcrB